MGSQYIHESIERQEIEERRQENRFYAEMSQPELRDDLALQNIISSVSERTTLPFIQQLIQTPSLSGQEEGVVMIIAEKMRELGYDEVTVDSMGNVVGLVRGRDHSRKIFYNGHIDHVDPGNLDAWDPTTGPYSGAIIDGRMYGRGTVDMIASFATQVLGVGLLKQYNIIPPCDIYVMGIVHEETREGVAFEHLFDQFGTPDAVILGEPTELDVKIGHRGRTEIEIETLGKTGHSGMPHLADNAVYKMAAVIDAINEINQTLPEHYFLGKATASIIFVDAWPNSATAIPDRCKVVIDRRTIINSSGRSETEEELIAEVEEQLRKKGLNPNASWLRIKVRELELTCFTGKTVKTKCIMPAWFIEEEHPLPQAGLTALRKIGLRPQLRRWEFSTDGNFSAGERNVPTIGFGPGDETVAHQPNESVPVHELLEGVRGNFLLALEVGSIL